MKAASNTSPTFFHPKPSTNASIEVSTRLCSSFPTTNIVQAINLCKKPQKTKLYIPIDFCDKTSAFEPNHVCKRDGSKLCVTSLKSGKKTNFTIPRGATVIDEFNREVREKEKTFIRLFIVINENFEALQEKTIKLVQYNGGISQKERKQEFLGSLENFKVISKDKQLCELFTLPIIRGVDEKLCAAVKSAIKDFDSELLYANFRKRTKITSDVFFILVERLIGVKLLRGKIQLTPCINITKDFELYFSYKNKQYSFKVTERKGSACINYQGKEMRQSLFLEVN